MKLEMVLNELSLLYLVEVFYQNQRALGLTFAWVSDCLPISLCSQDCWNCSFLSIKITQVNEAGDWVEEEDRIPHGSRITHIQEHIPWIEQRIKNVVQNGRELWEYRKLLSVILA
ncbi:hypothetical protein [Spirulina subsalsa]|uniref:hypothetical protein n=1 Tax=Spirulina subsalsa TaxID=54311 RepID=UPI0002F716E8|nr:hypothetical protein [Spirulina subsalsa]